MQRTVKVIKRRRAMNAESIPGGDGFRSVHNEKTNQQRETANAV
jgi:hypothetical protein